jgi:hypothetical protein
MTRTKPAKTPIANRMKRPLPRTPSHWCEKPSQQQSDEDEEMLKHVLSAMERCDDPTTANVAAEAGISEVCCMAVLLFAKELGLVECDPDLKPCSSTLSRP